jgi:hypothetical protein
MARRRDASRKSRAQAAQITRQERPASLPAARVLRALSSSTGLRWLDAFPVSSLAPVGGIAGRIPANAAGRTSRSARGIRAFASTLRYETASSQTNCYFISSRGHRNMHRDLPVSVNISTFCVAQGRCSDQLKLPLVLIVNSQCSSARAAAAAPNRITLSSYARVIP